jgi:hypothetical protein
MEIAYRASFAPGEGYLVYAGTGSIGAFIDADGQFHRAGGRGVVLDDGGGGFWIAREALRHIWRLEDERPAPGATRRWRAPCSTRRRRRLGFSRASSSTARNAAPSASWRWPSPPPPAGSGRRAILREAGRELARLARALMARFGRGRWRWRPRRRAAPGHRRGDARRAAAGVEFTQTAAAPITPPRAGRPAPTTRPSKRRTDYHENCCHPPDRPAGRLRHRPRIDKTYTAKGQSSAACASWCCTTPSATAAR